MWIPCRATCSAVQQSEPAGLITPDVAELEAGGGGEGTEAVHADAGPAEPGAATRRRLEPTGRHARRFDLSQQGGKPTPAAEASLKHSISGTGLDRDHDYDRAAQDGWSPALPTWGRSHQEWSSAPERGNG